VTIDYGHGRLKPDPGDPINRRIERAF